MDGLETVPAAQIDRLCATEGTAKPPEKRALQ
jgi:hypothetical protein